MSRYILKNFDEDLMIFSLERGEFNSFSAKIEWVTSNTHLLPEKLSTDEYGILSWLKGRMIPQNRTFVREILSSQQLEIHDLIGQIDICMGLSVNDSYWVTREDFTGTWQEYNLYDNEFSEALSLVAFTGYSQPIKELSPSPEMTTNGQLPKTWKRENEKLLLYKGATDEKLFGNGGKEPYSEFYVSQIAHAMEIDHVDYDLKKFKGILASTCENFTNQDVSYVPIGKTLEKMDIPHLVEKMKSINCMDKFEDMVLLDAVIYNEDRHYGNFGLLKDNHTGKYLGLAPLFDHGYSLFARCSDKRLFDKKEFKIYQEDYKVSLLGATHTQLVKWFCNKEDLSKLRKLYNFKFDHHKKYNLPEKRLHFLENYIQERAITLTKIIESEMKQLEKKE